MWKKVTKDYSHLKAMSRAARQTTAVRRNRTGAQNATFIAPRDMLNGERVNIYSDGNGRLAFAAGERGEYAITRENSAATVKVTIPRRWAERIPYGTTDVQCGRDGDMLVLDLNQIGRA